VVFANIGGYQRELSCDRIGVEGLEPDSLIRVMAEHWHAMRPADRLPGREHLDPLGLPRRLLPWLLLLDVVRDGDRLDFRYRLVGTSNVAMVGFDPTGKLASEAFHGAGLAVVTAPFVTTVNEGAPTYWIANIPHPRVDAIHVERGFFPLADDGRTVDRLIGVAMPRERSEET
jgi:hypothetical protein